VQGRYCMYFGEQAVFLATSEDLIHWKVVEGATGKPLQLMHPRPGFFDSALTEIGPPGRPDKAGNRRHLQW
jgi:hypothetical protein